MIYWVYGQPGSGKTTLAKELVYHLDNDLIGNQIRGPYKTVHIDGDGLREIFNNKDYSKEGRIKNISTAISIARFLANKNYICILSIVAPYRFLRDELKTEFDFLEIYLHTTEIRGRENFFAKDYEVPIDKKTLKLDTGKLTIKECTNEILNVYRKMAAMAQRS